MLGQCTTGATMADNRIFVYEVTGLQQNEVTQERAQPVRSSSSQFIQVPFYRMNEEMQRILMLGGKIVNISPLNSSPLASMASASTADTEATEEEKESD